MLYRGVTSVTFRKLTPKEIIELTVKAGLDGIEWGGDIHVPHGDIRIAEEVRKMTEDSGLHLSSYGSYYFAGCNDDKGDEFSRILETALTLNTPTIRVWAGNRSSSDADVKWRERVAEDSRRIAMMAEQAGVTISFEYHGNTLTDTSESTICLINAINHKSVRTYWQPSQYKDVNANLQDLNAVVKLISNVHVFHWNRDERLPLSHGKGAWENYGKLIRENGTDHYFILEFVKDDSPDVFLKDAETLKNILEYIDNFYKY